MNRRGGFTLIEIVVVLVIIVLLMTFLIPRLTGGGKDAAGHPVASPRQRAEQTVGVSDAQQIEQAIAMYRTDNDGENPPDLKALKRYGVTDEILLDPVTREPLTYDPQTGKIGSAGGGPVLPRAPGF